MTGICFRRLAALAGALALAGCFSWENDVERGGYAFSKYRLDAASGVHVGVLAEDAEADGFTCRADGWAHFRQDWSLEACFLADSYDMTHMTIPAGTWVMPREDRLVVAFAADTPCQGYVCGGTGGTKGTHTVFYPDGRLRAFFPPEDTQVGRVLCKATPLANIQLYPDGTLKRCVAAAGGEIDGSPYRRNDTVALDETGRPL